MIPDKTNPKWESLVTGKLPHQFKSIPAGMCISRMIRETGKDSSPDKIASCIDEVMKFFIKYENITQDDLKAIFG